MDHYDLSSSAGYIMTTLMPKYEEQTFIEFKASRVIINYGFPFLILTGSISNVVSLLILRCKSFKTSSVSFSLSVLSVVNLGILYVAVLRLWVLELTDRTFEFRVTSFGCKVHIMLTYLLCHMSSWTLVLIVLERTFIICFPLAAKPYCSRKNTILVWCITTSVLVLINCHFLWTFDYIPDPLQFSYFEIKSSEESMTILPNRLIINETDVNSTSWTLSIPYSSNDTQKKYEKICYAHQEYLDFYHKVWPWIDAFVISIIPFLLLLTGNVAIVITISKAVKFRKETATRLSLISSNKTNSVFSEAPQSSCPGTMDRKALGIQRAKANKRKTISCGSDRNSASSSTYMLLGASFLFLFLTTPSGVYLLVSEHLFLMDDSPKSVAKYRLCFAVTVFLYFLNNSINFFIYYLTGSRFRKSFKECFSSRDTLDSEGRLSDGGTEVTKLRSVA